MTTDSTIKGTIGANTSGLPDRLRAGVEALRVGRHADAVTALEPAARDPVLSKHPDMQDIRARVCSLLAQALVGAGRPKEAQQWVATALRILRQHPNDVGQQAVRQLQERIDAAAGAELAHADPLLSAMVRARSAAELVENVVDGARRSELLNRKANAHIDDGEPAAGASVAHLAHSEALGANHVRGMVLALLTLARAEPSEANAHLHGAWRIADDADDFTLVAAVAHTAALHEITLETTR